MLALGLEFAVRVSLVAMATAGTLWMLRVKQAAVRHAAWTGVLAIMMLTPVWLAWGPRLALRVLPMSTPAAAAGVLAAPSTGGWSWMAVVYGAGAALLLLRLAIGTLRARRIARDAARVDGVLTTAACAGPLTVGWIVPSVLLPENFRAWPQAQLEAVLTHEGEHARRRDPLVQWLAMLSRAVFWFHPLAWWLERELSRLAEEACDDAVLRRGHSPAEYAHYLLELARAIEARGSRLHVAAMAMPGSSLPQRIRTIMTRGPIAGVTRGRIIALAAAVLSVSVMCIAATIEQEPVPPLPPIPPEAVPTRIPAPPPVPSRSQTVRAEKTPPPPSEAPYIVPAPPPPGVHVDALPAPPAAAPPRAESVPTPPASPREFDAVPPPPPTTPQAKREQIPEPPPPPSRSPRVRMKVAPEPPPSLRVKVAPEPPPPPAPRVRVKVAPEPQPSSVPLRVKVAPEPPPPPPAPRVKVKIDPEPPPPPAPRVKVKIDPEPPPAPPQKGGANG